ncbi:hypothetical protein M9458_027692, partial [Cirrhinus mrigala]
PCLFVTLDCSLRFFDILPVLLDLRSRLALDITVCLVIDPACFDYDLLIKLATGSYTLSTSPALYRILRLPKIQRLSRTQITMDLASRLFCLRQGNRCIEDYVGEFCELCRLVGFDDVALKDIFRVGLNDPIRLGLPGGKIHWTLEQYIDYALLLAGSSFTVGVADKEPCNPTAPSTLEHFHTPTFMSGIIQVMSEPYHAMPAKPKSTQVMSTTPRPVHVTSAKLQPAHVTSAKPQPAHATSAKPQPAHPIPAAPRPDHVTSSAPGPAHAMPATPEPAHAMPAAPGPAHAMPAPVMAARPESAPVMAARPESAPVMATLLQPAHKMAAFPEPVHKMAAVPEPVHKMAGTPKPVHKMAAIPEPLHKMVAVSKPRFMMAHVLDSPLMAVWAAKMALPH